MKSLSVAVLVLAIGVAAQAQEIIKVEPCEGDATAILNDAIAEARSYAGTPVTIRLSPGDYHISRVHALRHPYNISNTASASENPDRTKHIGLLFKDLDNVTFDGNGARIVTHGEMTTFVVDHCTDISLTNFTLSAADPSVPEFKVTARTDSSITFAVTPPSRFEITKGLFSWVGEGWRFAGESGENALPELAQVFYPDENVTLRCDSPLEGQKRARQVGENRVEIVYDSVPDVHVGEVYQMRHGIRNEVCAFINNSRNIRIADADFNFMGNFGLVGQYSENISYDNIRCCPDTVSGRTNAGFADFVQMSGCKGRIKIVNSHFEGAHDDPVNVHGTHLQAVESAFEDRLTVRFMHDQTYGFVPFFEGDSVEIVDRHSLLSLSSAVVRDVHRVNDYDIELTLDRPMPVLPESYDITDIAVENITWTPEVEIRNNYFARTPTRGILITTRRRSVIEGNTFFRIPMASVLVSDDARGWYESGPVRDLTIRNNTFIDCASPVVDVLPEVSRYNGPVHSNISIENNKFIVRNLPAINLKATDNVRVYGNVFEVMDPVSAATPVISADNVTGLVEKENRIVVMDNPVP